MFVANDAVFYKKNVALLNRCDFKIWYSCVKSLIKSPFLTNKLAKSRKIAQAGIHKIDHSLHLARFLHKWEWFW
jgi:hypothetical protein